MDFVTLSSNHGWFTNPKRTLSLRYSEKKLVELIWTINQREEITSTTTTNRPGILTYPVKDGVIANDMNLIFWLFSLLGLGPENLICSVVDQNLLTIYKHIHALKFEKPMVPIAIHSCGCNMGYCGAIMG